MKREQCKWIANNVKNENKTTLKYILFEKKFVADIPMKVRCIKVRCDQKRNQIKRSMSHVHALVTNKLGNARSFDHASILVRSCHLAFKRTTTPILTKMNPLHPEMIYAKMPSGFGVEVFYNVCVVKLFCYFLPLGKAVAHHLNNLVEIGPEQTYINSLYTRMFGTCFGPVVLINKILNLVNLNFD